MRKVCYIITILDVMVLEQCKRRERVSHVRIVMLHLVSVQSVEVLGLIKLKVSHVNVRNIEYG